MRGWFSLRRWFGGRDYREEIQQHIEIWLLAISFRFMAWSSLA